jgi:hypothetical protein
VLFEYIKCANKSMICFAALARYNFKLRGNLKSLCFERIH